MTDVQNESYGPGCSPEIESPAAGGYASGLIGALIGAAVGTVPWFLAATFAGFYIGWLGFLIGWAALFGYKLLHGAKNTAYSIVVIYLLSLLAIGAAYFFSSMVYLFEDADFAFTVQTAGISKTQATWLVLTDSSNTALVIRDLGVSYLIGVLGLLSIWKSAKAYTDPSSVSAAASAGTVGEIADTGFSLPAGFELREKKGNKIIGIICIAFFGICLVSSLIVGLSSNDAEMYACAAGFTVFTLLGVLTLMSYNRHRLTVSGENITFSSFTGKAETFTTAQIGFVKKQNLNSLKLYSPDGRQLAKVSTDMENYPLFLQFLVQRNVELRG
jgi:hypothetical protein